LNRGIGALALTVIAAGLIGAGCGGDDDDDTTTATGTSGVTGVEGSTSKQAFIAEADEICTEGSAELGELLAEEFGSERPSTEEIEQFVTDTLVPKLEEQFAELRALTPPEGDEEEVDELLTAGEEGVEQIEDDPNLVVQNQQPEAFKEADRLASDYGFEACGGG
jgi:hypothetical protein